MVCYSIHYYYYRRNPLKILAQKLCNGDYNMQIKIELWDYRGSGDHEYMGDTRTSVN